MLDSLQILMLSDRMLQHLDTFSHAEVTLYAGLRSMGVNVIMYPWFERYHAPMDRPQDAWGLQFWCTRGGHNGLSQQVYTYDDLMRMVFDLIIATPRFVRTEVGVKFLTDAITYFDAPLVMLNVDDGGAYDFVIDESLISAKFQAEVPLESEEDVHSLPQSIMYPSSMLTALPKTYGVNCFLSRNHPTDRRKTLVGVLSQLNGRHLVGIVDGQGPMNTLKYYDILQQSKIKYGIRGNGYNSQHFWEGMAAEGVMLIADIEHKIPEPVPEPGVHYIQLDDNNIIEQAEYWLAHDEEREEIAVRSRDFVYRYHTPKDRARYFLEMCSLHIPHILDRI